jgi:hypothetical protein
MALPAWDVALSRTIWLLLGLQLLLALIPTLRGHR